MGSILYIFWNGFGNAAEVVVTITEAGIEWTAPANMMHWTLPDNLLHHSAPDNHLHWTLPTEDDHE